MSDSLTLDELAVPLRALRLLAADFGYLPAPDVDVTSIYPNRLRLIFHRGGLAGFEAWREALGIAPDAVRHSTQGEGGRTRVLRADAQCAGAELELVGYGDVPALASVGAA
ncbi:hypothetical protein [Streptomyces sp. NBC_00183]|uniref:hypothetical protein n=1 Tax=Streptomyces sp. NBC_00183 TaxID=2903633 RepID=UPI00224D8319|nr:hypothetical protein [Streptomyces sp. NBC_00183]MCX5293643.1 hypothetical protein [Streptomyces sp. NBC_00183]